MKKIQEWSEPSRQILGLQLTFRVAGVSHSSPAIEQTNTRNFQLLVLAREAPRRMPLSHSSIPHAPAPAVWRPGAPAICAVISEPVEAPPHAYCCTTVVVLTRIIFSSIELYTNTLPASCLSLLLRLVPQVSLSYLAQRRCLCRCKTRPGRVSFDAAAPLIDAAAPINPCAT